MKIFSSQKYTPTQAEKYFISARKRKIFWARMKNFSPCKSLFFQPLFLGGSILG